MSSGCASATAPVTSSLPMGASVDSITVVAALLFVATVPALAQTTSATTATVLGTVADSSGGSLPGVTVTLTGTSMMGVQTTVTAEDGGYRFISVPSTVRASRP